MALKGRKDPFDGLIKLNKLENQVVKLADEINENKQTIQALQLIISERDQVILALEAKLAFSQLSLLNKAVTKLQASRLRLTKGVDAQVIRPAIAQTRLSVDKLQRLVDQSKMLFTEKRQILDKMILDTNDNLIRYPEFAIARIKESLLSCTHHQIVQALNLLVKRALDNQSMLEENAIYSGKVLIEASVAKAKNLPNLLIVEIKQHLNHLASGLNKTANNLYPFVLIFVDKRTGWLVDVINQAIFEIKEQVIKSPYWDGKSGK